MPDRTRTTAPRSDEVPEWEVFLREDETETLRHVGSVSAPSAEAAHEQAAILFEDPHGIWLCPADELVRFSARSLEERGAP